MKTIHFSLQNTVRRLCPAGIFAAMMAGCGALPQGHATQKGHVTHVVVCWLKHHGNAAERNRLIEASKSFKAIPGVVDVTSGAVLPSKHPGNDSSFDVAVVITFADRQALADYGKSPVHLKAVKELLMPLASKYVIYDIVGE